MSAEPTCHVIECALAHAIDDEDVPLLLPGEIRRVADRLAELLEGDGWRLTRRDQ